MPRADTSEVNMTRLELSRNASDTCRRRTVDAVSAGSDEEEQGARSKEEQEGGGAGRRRRKEEGGGGGRAGGVGEVHDRPKQKRGEEEEEDEDKDKTVKQGRGQGGTRKRKRTRTRKRGREEEEEEEEACVAGKEGGPCCAVTATAASGSRALQTQGVRQPVGLDLNLSEHTKKE
eukprot:1852129-Rhodomonas_salina.2